MSLKVALIDTLAFVGFAVWLLWWGEREWRQQQEAEPTMPSHVRRVPRTKLYDWQREGWE